MAEFITIEPSLNETKNTIWEAIKSVFSERESISYFNYPLFLSFNNIRSNPDLVICDRHLGLIIINIIDTPIEQILSYSKEDLKIENQELNYIELGEKYSQVLKQYLDEEETIKNKIHIRSIIAFSQISKEQWQEKGFIGLEDHDSLIFNNQLSKQELKEKIETIPPYIYGSSIDNDEQWNNFLTVISGNCILKKQSFLSLSKDISPRRQALNQIQNQLYNWDVLQESIGKSIPPGMQRIRGIAGSGKTVLLCQKAALMHLKYPKWQIALVFFTRSLYEPIIELISKWVERFSNGEVKYNPEDSNLKVLHGWGGKRREGLYSYICKALQQKPGTPKNVKSRNPSKGLAELCKQLLEKIEIKPLFDSILIDEGQDFVTEKELKYEDRQAVYWLIYQSLKPVDAENKQRRLIWAFDEAQNLTNMIVPETKEIFGEELSQLIGGESGGIYQGGARKAYDMRCCYRTPAPILHLAYGLAFGFCRPDGILKRERMRKADWESLGYEVEGDFRTVDKPITITRPKYNSPNPLPEIWQDSLINFSTYDSREEELMALVTLLQDNLTKDFLQPREILIIALGDSASKIRKAYVLQKEIANFLLDYGINIYIPTALQVNQSNPQFPNTNPDLFWDTHNRGITITTVERAKGNEAEMVYLVGLDNIAYNESNLKFRNQLFVALTRTKAWLNLSGIGNFPFYEEVQKVRESQDRFTFTMSKTINN